MHVRIDVGGTAEKPPSGFLRAGLDTLSNRPSAIYGLPYLASIGPLNLTPDPYDFVAGSADSRANGRAKLIEYVRRCNDDHIDPGIAGYSLGAWVVSDFLDWLLTPSGRRSGLRVRYAVLVGNPRRNPDNLAPGHGIAGTHQQWNVPYADIGNPADAICCCPERSALRKLPYIGEVLTANLTIETLHAWARLAEANLLWPSMPPLEIWRNPQAYWQMIQTDITLLNGYVHGTAHGRGYFDLGLWQQAEAVVR